MINKIDISPTKPSYTDYFKYFCQKLGLNFGQAIMGEERIDSWKDLFSIFSGIIKTYNYKQKLNKENFLENKGKFENTLFLVGTNFIVGYIKYIKDSLNILKESKMNIYTSEKILDLDEELDELLIIIQEKNLINDWKGVRDYIDTFQERLDEIHLEVQKFNKESKQYQKEKEIQELKEKSIKDLKIKSWNKLLSNKNLSNQQLYQIQQHLLPENSLKDTTKDIIDNIGTKTKGVIYGINKLNLEDNRILNAIKSVQDREKDNFNNFSRQLRNDLHLKYGKASNDELYFNSLKEVVEESNEGDLISLNIIGYEYFNIEGIKKLENSKYHKRKVEFKKLGEDKVNNIDLILDTSKVIAGQQAKVGIAFGNKISKIEFLNINKITNIGVKIKKEEKKPNFKNTSDFKNNIFRKTKNYFINKYNNIFKKTA
ncbi:hypothetical protein H3C61_03370 [Candidatus Gracilibacteria bacterium]|nr:hypothetical protein [Candidatus Gracilibacteria bacterium]